MYKNAFNFWVLILYPTVLPNSFIKSCRFLVVSIGLSIYTIMSFANNDSFVSSFPVWMPFISFPCLIAVAKTFSTMLHRSGESGHPCLVPDFSGKAVVDTSLQCPGYCGWDERNSLGLPIPMKEKGQHGHSLSLKGRAPPLAVTGFYYMEDGPHLLCKGSL